MLANNLYSCLLCEDYTSRKSMNLFFSLSYCASLQLLHFLCINSKHFEIRFSKSKIPIYFLFIKKSYRQKDPRGTHSCPFRCINIISKIPPPQINKNDLIQLILLYIVIISAHIILRNTSLNYFLYGIHVNI